MLGGEFNAIYSSQGRLERGVVVPDQIQEKFLFPFGNHVGYLL